ncbi:MAG: glycosyltransferase family 39 protein [archaeon]|nr:MAG: glycosyltransferase family 39 protein [archaeon]
MRPMFSYDQLRKLAEEKDFIPPGLAVLFYILLKLIDYTRGKAFFDEGVYVGMAKFFASGGSSGYFEMLRPLGLPYLLTPLQLLPLSPAVTGRSLALVLTVLSIFMVYYVARETFGRPACVWASLAFAASPSILLFGGYILNDIFAYTLALFSTFLLLREKGYRNYLLSGFFLGIAFVFKFSAAAILPVLVFYIVFTRLRESPVPLGAHLLGVAAGSLPYFLFNLFFYAGPILERLTLPLSKALGVVQTGTWIYGEAGFLSYLSYLFTAEIILTAGAMLGLYFLLKKKNRPALLFVSCTLLFFLFFCLRISRFDARYLVSVLPFLAVLAGPGISESIQKIKKEKIFFLVLLLVLLPALITVALTSSLTEFRHDKRLEESISSCRDDLIFTNEALTMLYSPTKTVLLPGPNLGHTFLQYRLNESAGILVLNPEGYFCSPQDYECISSYRLQLGRMLSKNTLIDCGHLHGAPVAVISKQPDSEAITMEECTERMGYESLRSPESETFVRLFGAVFTKEGELQNSENILHFSQKLDRHNITFYLIIVPARTKPGEYSVLKDLPESTNLGILETPGISSEDFISNISELTGMSATVLVPRGDDWIGKEPHFPASINLTITGAWDSSPVPVRKKRMDIYTFDYQEKELINLEDFKILYSALLAGDYEIGVDIPAPALTDKNMEAL